MFVKATAREDVTLLASDELGLRPPEASYLHEFVPHGNKVDVRANVHANNSGRFEAV